MEVRLSRRGRWWAACTLAALYALCVLAPAAAFAFGDSARAVHCLTDDHHGLAKSKAQSGQAADHIHRDGSHHQHATADHDETEAPSSCCGWACLSVLPAAVVEFATERVFLATLLSARHEAFASRGPDLIYRPPISLLSA
jgi:hypothetical protein